jgi:GNAT superfamily N-acetyltransferase
VLSLSTDADLRVADAELVDVPPMARVRVVTWHTVFPGVVPEKQLHAVDQRSSEFSLAAMIHSRRRGRRVLKLVDRDDTIVGYATAGPHRGRLPYQGEIYDLYVHPDHHGRGGGRLLWSRASWALAELGLLPIMLWTPEHGPSRGFYGACGGVVIAKGNEGGTPVVAYGWPDALPLPLG